MRKLILALPLLFLFTTPLWVNGGNRWEGVLTQAEQGKIQLAVTAEALKFSTLPETLTRNEVVEWLAKGWLVPEKTSHQAISMSMPAPNGRCHLIVVKCGHTATGPLYCDVCVSGDGQVHCPCRGRHKTSDATVVKTPIQNRQSDSRNEKAGLSLSQPSVHLQFKV
jgi:hypothetical protein